MPTFLGPAVAIPEAAPLEALGVGTSKNLPFNMEKQQQTQWCWAAASVSVSKFYTPGSSWTQCVVANRELNRTNCCTDGGSCNTPWYLDRALTLTDNYVTWAAGPGSFSEVSGQVNANRPFGCRIEWNGGKAHFVVLAGFRNAGGVNYVDVYDPFYGFSQIPIAKFTNSYKDIGRWTHRYYTRAPVTA